MVLKLLSILDWLLNSIKFPALMQTQIESLNSQSPSLKKNQSLQSTGRSLFETGYLYKREEENNPLSIIAQKSQENENSLESRFSLTIQNKKDIFLMQKTICYMVNTFKVNEKKISKMQEMIELQKIRNNKKQNTIKRHKRVVENKIKEKMQEKNCLKKLKNQSERKYQSQMKDLKQRHQSMKKDIKQLNHQFKTFKQKRNINFQPIVVVLPPNIYQQPPPPPTYYQQPHYEQMQYPYNINPQMNQKFNQKEQSLAQKEEEQKLRSSNQQNTLFNDQIGKALAQGFRKNIIARNDREMKETQIQKNATKKKDKVKNQKKKEECSKRNRKNISEEQSRIFIDMGESIEKKQKIRQSDISSKIKSKNEEEKIQLKSSQVKSRANKRYPPPFGIKKVESQIYNQSYFTPKKVNSFSKQRKKQSYSSDFDTEFAIQLLQNSNVKSREHSKEQTIMNPELERDKRSQKNSLVGEILLGSISQDHEKSFETSPERLKQINLFSHDQQIKNEKYSKGKEFKNNLKPDYSCVEQIQTLKSLLENDGKNQINKSFIFQKGTSDVMEDNTDENIAKLSTIKVEILQKGPFQCPLSQIHDY